MQGEFGYEFEAGLDSGEGRVAERINNCAGLRICLD